MAAMELLCTGLRPANDCPRLGNGRSVGQTHWSIETDWPLEAINPLCGHGVRGDFFPVSLWSSVIKDSSEMCPGN